MSEIKKWHVHAAVIGSTYVGEIECKKESLEDLVFDMDGAYPSFCNHCSSGCEGAETRHFTASSGDDEWTDGDSPPAASADGLDTLRALLQMDEAGMWTKRRALALIRKSHPGLKAAES